jgi:hypothetical protein
MAAFTTERQTLYPLRLVSFFRQLRYPMKGHSKISADDKIKVAPFDVFLYMGGSSPAHHAECTAV